MSGGRDSGKRRRRLTNKKATGSRTRLVGLELAEGDVVSERYKIVRFLGSGGFGRVYEVEDQGLRAAFALKFLSTIQLQEEELGILRKEALLSIRLSHENLVRVNHFDVDNGFPYIVMELLDVADLAELLAEKKRLSVEEVSFVARGLCAGLSYAHRKGLVHRDVKPNNIGYVTDGDDKVVKLGDFGLAMRVRTAQKSTVHKTDLPPSAFTVEYSSPEQLSNKDVDQRSDLFSLAVTLYQLLCGELPFRGDTPMHLMFAITTAEPRPLKAEGLAACQRDAIFKAMSKNPDDRFPTVADFLDAFEGRTKVVVKGVAAADDAAAGAVEDAAADDAAAGAVEDAAADDAAAGAVEDAAADDAAAGAVEDTAETMGSMSVQEALVWAWLWMFLSVQLWSTIRIVFGYQLPRVVNESSIHEFSVIVLCVGAGFLLCSRLRPGRDSDRGH